jgi:hypothetical protein
MTKRTPSERPARRLRGARGSAPTRDLSTVEVERVAEIQEEHEACLTASRSAVEHAYRVGELLIEVKKKLKHGEYGRWVDVNCPFKHRTAQVYVQIAKNFPDAQAAARFATVERVLGSLSESSKRQPAKAEIGDPDSPDAIAARCNRIWLRIDRAEHRLDESRLELRTLLSEHATDDKALHELADRASVPYGELRKLREDEG